ncbi:MAG TPA: SDR family oxidoreductase [Oculatellaceae cyanobacterium]|jgi:short-subunit dehydrogenase
MQIKDSVVIVTGASSGIGLSTAHLLQEQGTKVVLAARSVEKLTEIARELPDSLVVPTDMTDFQTIKDMVQKTESHYGRIDALINNAGRGYEATIEEIDPETFERLYRLNVLGPVIAMQQVIPIMRKLGGGAIVNISSGTSLMKIPAYGAYSSSKRALNGLSLTATAELAADNIKVSLVYPALTATNFGVNKILSNSSAGQDLKDRPATDYSDGDTPEYIAQIILKALVEGEAEYFAHERMKQLGS